MFLINEIVLDNKSSHNRQGCEKSPWSQEKSTINAKVAEYIVTNSLVNITTKL